MPSLIFNNVSFSFSMPLLQSVSFECSPAERICIVGPNGAGKTTLLRLASGELKPDGGTITGLGASMPALEPKMTVGEILNHATRTTRKLLQQFNTLSAKLASGDPDIYTEYDRVLNQLSAIDGWSLDTLISSTLAGVNLATIANQPDRLVDSLSPGQQGRLQLVAAILARPETLILDEPTNHLDTQGVRFLVELVHRWSGSVLFASHDRAFINAVATSILDLDTTAWRAVALATGTPLNNGVYIKIVVTTKTISRQKDWHNNAMLSYTNSSNRKNADWNVTKKLQQSLATRSSNHEPKLAVPRNSMRIGRSKRRHAGLSTTKNDLNHCAQ